MFCLTKKLVVRLREVYQQCSGRNASYFRGDMKDGEREFFQSWRASSSRLMIAICVFGVGVDYSSVEMVIHYSAVRTLIDYIQETGRARRDGLPAVAITVTSTNYQQPIERLCADTREWDAMSEHFRYLNCAFVCRRQQLSVFNDGEGLPCLTSLTSQQCDVCAATSVNFSSREQKRQHLAPRSIATQRNSGCSS